MRNSILFSAVLAVVIVLPARAAENLKLNDHLDYTSDSFDGPLITGDSMQEGVSAGVPNYIIIYGERCYNSKHQAQRTVELYNKYRGRAHFVIIDLDQKRSAAQDELVNRYYGGSIPHVVVLDHDGHPVYNAAGEVGSDVLSTLLDRLLSAR